MPLSDLQTAAPIRVVLVDDSSFMRSALRNILERHEGIRVVGAAADGIEAIEMVRALRPSVVTMDIEMPRMNGLEAAEAIIAEHGGAIPIIMVSSHSAHSATATLRALRLGTVDFVSKATTFLNLDIGHIEDELVPKVRQWAARDVPCRPAPQPVRPAALPRVEGAPDLVVIGASTGGPATLPLLLREMAAVTAPIVVAQHMPAFFTGGLAENLAHELKRPVVEGIPGREAVPGSISILGGGKDSKLMPSPVTPGAFSILPAYGNGTIHPSVDILFESAVEAARNPVAVILTGMGADGTKGALRFQGRRCPVLVQTPDSSIVPGMPSSAIEAGAASHVLGVAEIGGQITRWSTQSSKNSERR